MQCTKLFANHVIQVAVPFRLTCMYYVEDRLAVVIMLFTGPYFLFFCR